MESKENDKSKFPFERWSWTNGLLIDLGTPQYSNINWTSCWFHLSVDFWKISKACFVVPAECLVGITGDPPFESFLVHGVPWTVA